MLTGPEIISLIQQEMPTEVHPHANSFTKELTPLSLSNPTILLSTTTYSEEDLISKESPYHSGWNSTVAAISTLLATGGVPKVFTHALTVNREWDETELRFYASGVADALKEYGVQLSGGDVTFSDCFRTTITLIGEPQKRSLTPKGASVGDLIYISGKIGAGNLNALVKLYGGENRMVRRLVGAGLRFPLRSKEATLIGEFATSAISSKKGLFNALTTLAQSNECGYLIEKVPYMTKGVMATTLLSHPKDTLFFGGCGEYELLCTIPVTKEKEFLKEAKKEKVHFYRIGVVTAEESLLQRGHKAVNLPETPLEVELFSNKSDYIDALLAQYHTWKGQEPVSDKEFLKDL